jgi:oxygen-dependent protoporphyrinogen oxidase
LTAAFYLKRKGIPVTLYEAGDRTGGVIRSTRGDGYLAEWGPNTLLETAPQIGRLIRDAGLESRRLDADPGAEGRYLVRAKRLVAVPRSLLGFVTTPLFSPAAKGAFIREPFIRPRRGASEESVAQFVVRRLNQEVLDRAIDPLVGGIFAGDPHKLSVTHAFPKLKALEDNYGSLLKGQIFGRRERKARAAVSKDRATAFSFDEGLQVLTDTLRLQLGDAVRLDAPVARVTETAAAWTVTVEADDGEVHCQHSAVVFCGTASRLAKLRLVSERPLSLSPFSQIRYAPVASVVLGFRRENVTHSCKGFGVLVPKGEGFKILGTIFSSSLFPNRAPAGHHTLTSYVGVERAPELAALPADELCDLVRADLSLLLGAKGQPTFQHHAHYPQAIPQYNVGYGRYRDLMTEMEAQSPGLFLAGHYRDGVSLGDSIVSACQAVERVERHLAPGRSEAT